MTLGRAAARRPILGTWRRNESPVRVREYCDQELLGGRSPLLARTRTLPEVEVRKLPR